MQTQKTPPRITLTPSNRLRVPPHAETRARMPTVAATLRSMQTPVFVLPQDASKSRIAELESQLNATRQQLHNHASQAWLEEEARLQREAMERRVQRQHYRDTAHVRDNTLPDLAPQVVATTDAVHLKLPLNPRTAIPMDLPWLSILRNWLRLKW